MALVMTRLPLAVVAGAATPAVALAVAVAVLEHRTDPRVHVSFALVSLLTGAVFAGVGALLMGVRPGNALGPVLSVAAAAVVVEFALREYGYRAATGSLPLAGVAAWAGFALDPLFFPVPIAVVLLLFPDGLPPSRRWRPVLAAGVVVAGLAVVLLALRPGPLRDDTYGYLVAWRGALPAVAGPPVASALEVLNELGLLLLGVGVVTLLVRYRRADPAGRQRLRPLALAGVVAVLCLLAQGVPVLRGAGTVGLVAAVAVGFPLALAVGALRYRVWDLDPVMVNTIVYGVLTVGVTAVYVGVVVGLAALTGSGAGPPALLPSIAATVLVAVLFAPVKERVSRAARRLVYGVRASPYEALAALPHQLSETPAVDEVLPRTADALTLGLGVPRARVRAFLDGAPLVAWSPGPPAAGDLDLITVSVRHLGEIVGDVAVQPPPERPLGSADRRLLADLAAQAGPALRGVALAAELQVRIEQITAQSAQLRASRQRLAAAQVEERQRLERDIHDGAQQRLIAVAMSIQAAEDVLAADPDAGRAALRRCRDDLGRCIDDLRELARGVYPPVLAARGLPAALRARVRAAGGRVRVASSPAVDGARFGADVELAVYFACLEAMQNAAKHAPDAAVAVELSVADDTLCFAVIDDGAGFERGRAGGSGLLGMADRIGAVGGVLTVDSAPGRGTAVRGRVPVTSPGDGAGYRR